MRIPKFKKPAIKIKYNKKILILILISLSTLSLLVFVGFTYQKSQKLNIQIESIENEKSQLTKSYEESQKRINEMEHEDQRKKNKELEDEIESIRKAYKNAVLVYESLLDLKAISKNTSKFDDQLAEIFTLLSNQEYQKANDQITQLSHDIKAETDKISSAFTIPENLPVENTPPSSGYRRQSVQVDAGTFMVDIVSGDLGSTKVIVDTTVQTLVRSFL